MPIEHLPAQKVDMPAIRQTTMETHKAHEHDRSEPDGSVAPTLTARGPGQGSTEADGIHNTLQARGHGG